MTKELKTGLQRGLAAGLYGAALMFFTQLPQEPEVLSFVSQVALSFIAPFSFLAGAGLYDQGKHRDGGGQG